MSWAALNTIRSLGPRSDPAIVDLQLRDERR
jgi:hypothetical protein